MTTQAKEWYYGDEDTGNWVGPMTLDELDEVRNAGTIEDYTRVISTQMLRQQGPRGQGVPYHMISRVSVQFTSYDRKLWMKG